MQNPGGRDFQYKVMGDRMLRVPNSVKIYTIGCANSQNYTAGCAALQKIILLGTLFL